MYFTVRSYMRLNTVVICLQITMECVVTSRIVSCISHLLDGGQTRFINWHGVNLY